jgi:hypothetical protein
VTHKDHGRNAPKTTAERNKLLLLVSLLPAGFFTLVPVDFGFSFLFYARHAAKILSKYSNICS